MPRDAVESGGLRRELNAGFVAAIAVQRPFLRQWQGVLIDRFRLYRLAQDFIDAFHRLECARTRQALTLVIRFFCPLRDIATGASIGRMGA